MGEVLFVGGPKRCTGCGGFIAPGDETLECVDGERHPECVGRVEHTTLAWGPWVLGLTLLLVAVVALVVS